MPGIFCPFKVSFKENGASVSAHDQAVKILNEVAKLQKLGYKKVGITYSANQNQTNTIQATYAKTDGSWKTKTAGGNQAEVMKKVEDLLADDNGQYKHLRQVFRIVPITTMQAANSSQAASDQDVRNSLNAADTFMNDEGHVLLGWQNQNTKDKKLAIGGDLAKNITTQDQTNMIEAWVDATMKLAVPDPKNLSKYIPTTTTLQQTTLEPAAPTKSAQKGPFTATVETILKNGKAPSDTERHDFFEKLNSFLNTRNENLKTRNAKEENKANPVTASYNKEKNQIELSGSLPDVKAALLEFSKTAGNQNILHVLSDQSGEIICGFKDGKEVQAEDCKKIMNKEPELNNPTAKAKEQLDQLKPNPEPTPTPTPTPGKGPEPETKSTP